MEAEDIIIVVGFGFIVLYLINQQQQNNSFSDFMTSIGGNDVPDTTTDNSANITPDSSTLQQFADAIFHHEGGNPGNLNVRNNNPGNLKAAPDQFAQLGKDSNGFVIFASMDDGWAALNAQINRWVSEFPNLSLSQFFAKYLGQSDYLTPRATSQGDPLAYANYVAGKLGVSPDASLQSIFTGGMNV